MSQPSKTHNRICASMFKMFRFDNRISASMFKRFQYDESRHTTDDARKVLLVVVSLIAAVTFQAGVNPPGGVWQDGDHAGRAIYASQKVAFYVFLVSNTLALSTCILVITCFTFRFPFCIEIWAATASMMTTYASAVFAVTPHETVHFRYLLIAALVPFLMRILVYFFKKCRGAANDQNQKGGEKKDQQDGQAGDEQV